MAFSYLFGPDKDDLPLAKTPLVKWVDADPDDAHSAYLLGKGLSDGWFGEANQIGACVNFKNAAEKEDYRAYWYLGMCYLNGNYVPKDETLAFDWVIKSAEEDVINGLISAGVMYAVGQGVAKDPLKAASMYQRAIDLLEPESLDQAHAMRSLGAMHLFKEIENNDPIIGLALLELGAEGNDSQAPLLLKRVESLDEEKRQAVDREKLRLQKRYGIRP